MSVCLFEALVKWCDLAKPVCPRWKLINAGNMPIGEGAHRLEQCCVRERGGGNEIQLERAERS